MLSMQLMAHSSRRRCSVVCYMHIAVLSIRFVVLHVQCTGVVLQCATCSRAARFQL